jgi:hypothetical protein
MAKRTRFPMLCQITPTSRNPPSRKAARCRSKRCGLVRGLALSFASAISLP